jgi:hypothetical protein
MIFWLKSLNFLRLFTWWRAGWGLIYPAFALGTFEETGLSDVAPSRIDTTCNIQNI